MTGTDFFFVTIIDKQLHAHVSLQRTPLTRAGERVEIVASLSQGRTAAAQYGLFTHKSVPVKFETPFIIKLKIVCFYFSHSKILRLGYFKLEIVKTAGF